MKAFLLFWPAIYSSIWMLWQSARVNAQDISVMFHHVDHVPDNYAGIFGLAIDPADQSIYAWGQTYGNMPACNRSTRTKLEAYLIKFDSTARNIIWCQVYGNSKELATSVANSYFSSENGPIIDLNGDIYVQGTFWSVMNSTDAAKNQAYGLFLLQYSSCGRLLNVLRDDAANNTKTNEEAAGLTIDSANRKLYAGSRFLYESYFMKYDLSFGKQLERKALRLIWNNNFSPMLFTIKYHDNTLYGTGFDGFSYSAFLVAVRSDNFSPRTNSPMNLTASREMSAGIAMDIDPAKNSLYIAGASNWFENSSLWKLSLSDLTLKSDFIYKNSEVGQTSYVTRHPVTEDIFINGKNSLPIEILRFDSKGNRFNISANYGGSQYAAAFNASGYLIIVGCRSTYSTFRSSTMAIFGYQADPIARGGSELANGTRSCQLTPVSTLKQDIKEDPQAAPDMTVTIVAVSGAFVVLGIAMYFYVALSYRRRSNVVHSKFKQILRSSPDLVASAATTITINNQSSASGTAGNNLFCTKASSSAVPKKFFFQSPSTDYGSKTSHASLSSGTLTGNKPAPTVQMDTTMYQSSVKELAIPGPYLIQDTANAFKVLSVITKTAHSALMTAAPANRELIARTQGKTLAVKQITVKKEAHLQAFYLELSIMYLLRDNERFVELMGFTVQPYFSILTVFYPNGSLERFLYSSKSTVVCTKRMILTFAKQISEAVQILHKTGFAHCDLKPHNVMVDNCSDSSIGYRCRLGDFGLTQSLDDQHGQVKAFNFESLPGLTFVYAAPEAIMRFRQFTVLLARGDHYRRCDVYAVALMLYELSVRNLAWHRFRTTG